MVTIDWITLVVGLVIFMIINNITGYFKGKGSNLATKQDIEDITTKIESIRIQYTKELEKLKASLQVSVSNKSLIIEKSK